MIKLSCFYLRDGPFILFLFLFFCFFLEEGVGGKYEKKFLRNFYRRNKNRA